MAQATISKIRKGAHRVAMQTRAFLRLLDRHVRIGRVYLTSLVTSVLDLPAIRRSRLYRDGQWLWYRLTLLTSEGYDFEEYYRTQHGAQAGDVPVAAKAMDNLSGAALLSKACDLSGHAEGMAAMRLLVERAVLKAQTRQLAGRAVTSYAPKSHDQRIHQQWREAIEAAFAPARSPARPVKALPAFVVAARGKTSPAVAPLMVVDDAAFEMNLPEVLSYRAITRH